MTDDVKIPPSRQALAEALALSFEILKNIEMQEIPLSRIVLKAGRLARLINDFEHQKIMEYEASGYPSHPEGFTRDIAKLLVISGRTYSEKDPKSKEIKQMAYLSSIGYLEDSYRSDEIALKVAHDPDISISSANPYQVVPQGRSNQDERTSLRRSIRETSAEIEGRRAFIYNYVLDIHYALKFSGIADDIFTRIRQKSDLSIGKVVPDAIQILSAIYESLQSDNSENWSNAVHSCRRLLQNLADVVFPATQETRTKQVNGRSTPIKLGTENYINRLVAFIENNSESERFEEIVGSHLEYLGHRLDSIYEAANKGSHDVIVSREEADRYVVFTYLLVGDILSLYESQKQAVTQSDSNES